jgi:hypothetical protein
MNAQTLWTIHTDNGDITLNKQAVEYFAGMVIRPDSFNPLFYGSFCAIGMQDDCNKWRNATVAYDAAIIDSVQLLSTYGWYVNSKNAMADCNDACEPMQYVVRQCKKLILDSKQTVE